MGIFDKILMEDDTTNQNFPNENTSSDGRAIFYLSEMLENISIKEKSIYIEEIHLEIEPHVVQFKNNVAQVVYVLRHEMFQEELVESIAGVGPTSDEAIKQADINFISTALGSLIQGLKEENGKSVTVKLPNKENTFVLYSDCTKVQGIKKAGPNVDYWETFGQELSSHLGNKRVYWIKLYAAKIGENTSCECRINGMVYANLTKQLSDLAMQWETDSPLYSEKQYFLLIQNEADYKPYPMQKKEVEQFVLSSLLLFRQCDSQEAYEKIGEQIRKGCPIPSLGEELVAFIPEIFTEIIFSEVSYSDELVLIQGENEMRLSKHQVTSFDWMYGVIERTIRAGYYEKPQVDHIISCSALLSCINKALNDGCKIENLCTSGLAFPVEAAYEIL